MTKRLLLIKVLICLMSFGGVLYSYLSEQNDLTRLRIKIPELRSELSAVMEENMRLKFQAESFESPSHLLQLASRHEFTHLKHPSVDRILSLESFLAKNPVTPTQPESVEQLEALQPTIVLGAK